MMKKIFGIAVLSIFTVLAVQAQDFKFAHINTEEIIPMLPEYKSAVTTLENYQLELENTLELMQVELNNLAEAYNKDMANYTDMVRQVKEQELNDKNNRIQEFLTDAQEKMTTKQNELLQPMYLKVQAAIDSVGQENGFLYIFEASSIRYINIAKSTDALPLVKAKLGIN